MKKLSVLIAFVVLFSCSKSEKPAQPRWSTDPPQYGTPFQGVPAAKDAAIYQVNMRAFSEDGNLDGVTAKLDHIKSLGINVIYLMPIYPVGQLRSINSPYSIKDYKAVGAEFGNLEDLRELVDAAHRKEMAVILDFVANHSAWDHSWITEHRSWYQQDGSGEILSPNGYNDVAQLNFSNDSLRIALIEAMRYWVLAANVDGYRFDFADHVPVAFWKQAISSLRSIKDRELLLFAEGARNDHFRTGFDLIFGFSFYGNLKSLYADGLPATKINAINSSEYVNAFADSRVVRYISNHDINLSDGTPNQLFSGDKGALAAFVIAAYMKGVPMVYNGQEIGYDKKINYFQKDPIEWEDNSVLTEAYRKILSFRSSSAALREAQLFSYSSDDVIAFRKEKEGDQVLVLVNIRNRPVEYLFPALLANSSWKNAFTEENKTLGVSIQLEPFEYIVLKNK